MTRIHSFFSLSLSLSLSVFFACFALLVINFFDFIILISFSCLIRRPIFQFRLWLILDGYWDEMAVELMMGFGIDSFAANTTTNMEENAVKEAASAGIQSVEKFLRLVSQQNHHQQYHQDVTEYREVADVAVNKFKKVISLLDKGRTGHARFRRAPLFLPSSSSSSPPSDHAPTQENPSGSSVPGIIPINHQKPEHVGSAFKVYCPTPVLRLPPLPHNHNQQVQPRHNHHHQVNNASSLLGKNGSVDKKESGTTINFSPSPSISAANSFMSTLTGDTDSTIQPSLSSGLQLTNLSQSSGKPPLSSSSYKRKCSSVDDAAMRCGSSSERCHCSKKRFVFPQ